MSEQPAFGKRNGLSALSMNRPTPDPAQEGNRHRSASCPYPLLGGVRGGFMVPMHAQKRMKAFHEPTHCRPLPGGEQASVRVLSVPLPGGVRGGFMVPMHAQKRKEAFHEPTHSSSSSFSSSTFDPVSAISRTRPTTRTRTNQF